ncbi:hypothetical protein GW17_00011023 [Ensete ventricosum]|nr:hypothetical protein GW17_00011023 [Ensete ventricosum]
MRRHGPPLLASDCHSSRATALVPTGGLPAGVVPVGAAPTNEHQSAHRQSPLQAALVVAWLQPDRPCRGLGRGRPPLQGARPWVATLAGSQPAGGRPSPASSFTIVANRCNT